MTPELKRDRAAKAAQILESEIFHDAIVTLEAKYRRELETVSVENVLQLQIAHIRLNVLKQVLGELSKIVRDGVVAVHEIETIRQRR